jgi:tRNA threonylcarbamoyladenosine biosynthesis protein TsaE
MTILTLNLPSEADTLAAGALLAKLCVAPMLIFLQGELGAGKSTFVRGFLRGLGYKNTVKSPTYTLVEPYEIAGKSIFHFDLYRLNDPSELAFIGIDEYLTANAIVLIEWPERAISVLPSADLTCYIESFQQGRQLVVTAQSAKGCDVSKQWSLI